MNIHLKTKPVAGEQRKFAFLVEPDGTGLSNDAQLYERVQQHGKAVISRLSFTGTQPSGGKEETLTPAEFEQEWMGD